jgi:endonuclease/exonuclease/phosphatase family metal-dependent hydrolase
MRTSLTTKNYAGLERLSRNTKPNSRSLAISIVLLGLLNIPQVNAVESLRVMSYNIWGGGFTAGQPLSQTAAVISAAGADIIGLQEASVSADDIANLLGFYWHSFNIDLSIVSRYPITEVIAGGFTATTRGVKIQLSPGQEVYLFDSHLAPYPYQPYDIRDGLITSEAQAIASAESARGSQMNTMLSNVSTAIATGLPVFLVGDFNEPSHLDWTQQAADAGLNFDMKIDWPASNKLASAGFVDAFREVRPDEVNDQARTWTPGAPPPTIAANEVHDRIDFVYYHAPSNVVATEALTIGYDVNDGFTDISVQPYPSDHRAVVVEFDLNYSNQPGDFDFDGDVDGRDFLMWQRGESSDPLSMDDLADWQANYGAGFFLAYAAVPEPAWGTMLIGMLLSHAYFCRLTNKQC